MSFNISLVLPCYNEEKNIPFLCKEFLDLPIQNYRAELILVNNGSTDNTKNRIQQEIKNNTSSNVVIKLVDLHLNKGYGGGIFEGLKKANGDVGALNQIIHVWQFQDDNSRRELWKTIYNDKDFIKFASEFRPLVLTQENKLMTAAPWTPFETN